MFRRHSFGDAAMPAPLSIRTDRDAGELRRLARRECRGRVSARLLALANALDGLPREEAARLAGMTGQTLGDWVHRYNEEGVEGLRDRPRSGRPCALDEGQQAALKALVLRGPDLEKDGCIAWRARDLPLAHGLGARPAYCATSRRLAKQRPRISACSTLATFGPTPRNATSRATPLANGEAGLSRSASTSAIWCTTCP